MFAGDSLVPISSSWQPPPQIYLPTSYRIIGNTNKVIEKDANLISFTVPFKGAPEYLLMPTNKQRFIL